MAIANGIQIMPEEDDGVMPDVVCVCRRLQWRRVRC